ncbi:MAG: Ig-like domain-containing protein [Balneolales bacterium]
MDPGIANEDGVPERGRFLLIYSYQGESIDPYIGVTRNGETIGSLSSLCSVSSETLVDVQLDKGDSIGFLAEYGKDSEFGYLHNSFASFVEGFWANQFSINFFLQDEDGNLVEYQGTMNITFYLIPPFNGFELLADRSPIAPGESTDLSLQAIEAFGVPVIIPDVTRVGLQTSTTGVRLGGVSLPGYGIRMVPGVTSSYSLLTETTLQYEADPDSSLLVGGAETVALLAYSPYNININGTTAVEVSVDEDDIILSVSTDKESVLPRKTGENTSAGITVMAARETDNEPVSGLPVLLSVTAVPNSGGHHHHEGRETGRLYQAEGVTDEEGVFTTTFTSSEIGGEEWIAASSSQASQRDSVMIRVQVHGLIPFPEGSYYQLTGADEAHPQNHFITNERARDHLITASAEFARASWNTSGSMRINDISIEWGGLFDLNQAWTNGRGHNSHRTGKDVDLENLVNSGYNGYRYSSHYGYRKRKNSKNC